MSVGLNERLGNPQDQQQLAIENALAKMHVAMPGTIVSFNPANQTASVQPCITENVKVEGADRSAMALPVISDVLVQFPHCKSYAITFPVGAGDECLLVFADSCIDGWWQSGGVQNQMESRRHDLSDAFAIVGFSSVPNAISGFVADAMRMQNSAGTAYVQIKGSDVEIRGGKVDVNGTVF